MKFVLVSDSHLLSGNPISRMDDLTETQWSKWKFVFDVARKNHATILQAGDLFDKPRSWILLPKFMDLKKEHPDVDLFLVRGQHDDYLYSIDTRDRTNLGVLEKAWLVTVLDSSPRQVTKDGQVVSLYGCSFGGEVPVPNDSSAFNILVIHASISDRSIYPGQEFTMAKKFLEKHSGFDLILCGDIHRSFMATAGKRFLFDVGPMLRREATEYNFSHKPHVVLFDTENPKDYKEITIPHNVADEILDRTHIERADEVENMLDGFVEQMVEIEVKDVSFEEVLWSLIKANNASEQVVKILSEEMEVQ